jgi:hypothetical protein
VPLHPGLTDNYRSVQLRDIKRGSIYVAVNFESRINSVVTARPQVTRVGVNTLRAGQLDRFDPFLFTYKLRSLMIHVIPAVRSGVKKSLYFYSSLAYYTSLEKRFVRVKSVRRRGSRDS